MDDNRESGLQLVDSGPEAFEAYLVPTLFERCAEQLLAAVGVTPGDRVVDVACGTGVVALRVADAAELPLADGAVDVWCCQRVLQFVPDPDAVLCEARRVLAPRGRLGVALWGHVDDNPAFAEKG